MYAGAEGEIVLKKLMAYYLPFDQDFAFQLELIWQNAPRYAYRNGIACLALAAIALTAQALHLPIPATIAHGLAIVTTFFASVFTAAALDPRRP